MLGTIAETSRDALAEMRRMVGVLRGGGDRSPTTRTIAPAPGVADLAELVEQVPGRRRSS